MRRPRLSTALTLLTIAATLVGAGVCAAARPAALYNTEAELRAYTACFAQALGVTPRWSVTVTATRDSVVESNMYGTTMTSSMALEAQITYNVYAIERDGYAPRIAALHEVLHVATGEMAGLAFAFDKELAGIEAERLVRQMVRWPSWRGVCTQP